MSVVGPTVRQEDVEAVASRVRKLPRYPDFPPAAPAYQHMGAVLADTGLQAGIDYSTVVQPRVRILLDRWPDATTTDRFIARIDAEGLHEVLRWPDAEKPGRVERLARLLAAEGVQTVEALGAWVMRPGSRDKLLALRGIGEKTADYLANLAGQPVAAVDRHLRSFVANAGVDVSRYGDVHALLAAVADHVQLNLGSLDREIWKFMSGGGDHWRSIPTTLAMDSATPPPPVASPSPAVTLNEIERLAAELKLTRAERDQALSKLESLRARLQAMLDEG